MYPWLVALPKQSKEGPFLSQRGRVEIEECRVLTTKYDLWFWAD